MKKNYIIPSVEITNIQMMQMIAVSAEYGGTEGPGVAESKAVDFSKDDNDLWSDDK